MLSGRAMEIVYDDETLDRCRTHAVARDRGGSRIGSRTPRRTAAKRSESTGSAAVPRGV